MKRIKRMLVRLYLSIKADSGLSVWSQIISSLGNIRSVFADNKTLEGGLKTFALRLVTPATEEIGWDFAPNENFLTGQMRALLISTAGNAGHEK